MLSVCGSSFIYADEAKASPKEIKKILEEGPYLETSQTGIKLSGYVDAGYAYNFIGRKFI